MDNERAMMMVIKITPRYGDRGCMIVSTFDELKDGIEYMMGDETDWLEGDEYTITIETMPVDEYKALEPYNE